MDPTLVTGGVGLGVLGALAVVLVALIRAQGSPARNASEALKSETARANDAERRNTEYLRQLDTLRGARDAAREDAFELRQQLAIITVQRDAAVAEADRLRSTLGSPP